MLNNKFLMSKRRQANLLAHFGFTKKSKTNDSEEQQEAGSLADDAFDEARGDRHTEAGDRVNSSSEAADGGDSTCLSLPVMVFQRLFCACQCILDSLWPRWLLVLI